MSQNPVNSTSTVEGTKVEAKEKLLFLKNFIKNPLQNASIIPSSPTASKSMMKDIDFNKIDFVLELGPGPGNFTKQILDHVKPGTKVVLVEIEDTYIEILKRKYGQRITIEKISAHRIDEVLAKHQIEKADLIVSGLPFLPEEIKHEMHRSIKRQTDDGAIFRFFTYMPGIMKKVYQDLPIQKYRFVFRNIPPMWIYGIN